MQKDILSLHLQIFGTAKTFDGGELFQRSKITETVLLWAGMARSVLVEQEQACVCVAGMRITAVAR